MARSKSACCSFAVHQYGATLAVDLGSGQHGHEVSLGGSNPRWWVQATLGGLAAAIVVVAWEMALRR